MSSFSEARDDADAFAFGVGGDFGLVFCFLLAGSLSAIALARLRWRFLEYTDPRRDNKIANKYGFSFWLFNYYHFVLLQSTLLPLLLLLLPLVLIILLLLLLILLLPLLLRTSMFFVAVVAFLLSLFLLLLLGRMELIDLN